MISPILIFANLYTHPSHGLNLMNVSTTVIIFSFLSLGSCLRCNIHSTQGFDNAQRKWMQKISFILTRLLLLLNFVKHVWKTKC